MTAGMEMSGRMLARRIVAASNVTAGHAESKMDPAHSGLETFLAALGRARRYWADQVQMTAFLHCILLNNLLDINRVNPTDTSC